ncbi:hypothetical protein [Desulfovibrio sp.]|uniref:hypothetical protein n=1 Tax=Desulfovibrio sp. TaxID=885 RepID=UPI0023CBA044|nr:hypothetical protein [Desulfovibrio sp.]MDE7240774.1 hypothetical protein [Desulfovibrio sp.]
MQEMCEGLRAVCAVLKELESCTRNAPALRLAERHLRLLARLAAREAAGEPGGRGSGGPGPLPLPLAAPVEASHVVQ